MELKLRDDEGVVHDLVVDTGTRTVSVNGEDPVPYRIMRREHGVVAIEVGGHRLPVEFEREGIRLGLLLDGVTHRLERETTYSFLQRGDQGVDTGLKEIRSPIPGVISGVHVAKGDEVAEGQVVCVLTAMKMENEIASPVTGVVHKVNAVEGASVGGDQVLIIVKD